MKLNDCFRLVFFHDACLGLDDPADVHKAKNKVLKDVLWEYFFKWRLMNSTISLF